MKRRAGWPTLNGCAAPIIRGLLVAGQVDLVVPHVCAVNIPLVNVRAIHIAPVVPPVVITIIIPVPIGAITITAVVIINHNIRAAPIG